MVRTLGRIFTSTRQLGNVALVICLSGCGSAAERSDESGDVAEAETAESRPGREEAIAPKPSMVDSIGAPLGPISEAIVRLNEQTDRAWNLVARLETRPNEILEFYEPAPGVLLISGAGAPDVEDTPGPPSAATEQPHVHPRDIWAAASRGVPVPAALTAAIGRWEQYDPSSAVGFGHVHPSEQESTTSVDPPSPDLGRVTQALHGPGWCEGNYEVYDVWWNSTVIWPNIGSCPSSGFEQIHCLNHASQSTAEASTDALLFRTNVCPSVGEVRLKLWSPVFPSGSWTVPQNTVRWGINWLTSCTVGQGCTSIKSSVDWVTSSERYNYRFMTQSCPC